VSSGVTDVRRLVGHRGRHRVVSLYLDLDPERFATPPARASQIRSLIDKAARDVERRDGLGHEDKLALRDDVQRIDEFLRSPAVPFKGARGLAVFCSGRDDLFEVKQLSRPVEGRVMISQQPYVEPMLRAVQERRWLVALVSRRSGRILTGSPERLSERRRVEDNVHSQHHQGGWSQARYERSVEKDADDHLREVALAVSRAWRRERFDRVALGGPHEVVARFEELLPEDVRACLARARADVDLSSATDADIRAAVETIVLEEQRRTELAALQRLSEGVGGGRGAVHGVTDSVSALNERRVQTLLLAPEFDGTASRCQACGLLIATPSRRCPADGTELEEIESLREAAVESAVAQGAGVLALANDLRLAPRDGIGALLRF
jgi:peptide chain release factor subunit 1